MLSALLSFLSGLAAKVLRDLVADWRRDQALKDAGAAEAALDTLRSIQEIADAQHENDMRVRGGAPGVADRLRKRLTPDGGANG